MDSQMNIFKTYQTVPKIGIFLSENYASINSSNKMKISLQIQYSGTNMGGIPYNWRRFKIWSLVYVDYCRLKLGMAVHDV